MGSGAHPTLSNPLLATHSLFKLILSLNIRWHPQLGQHSRMKSSVLALICILGLGSPAAQAAFSCEGALTDAQLSGFERLFTPAYSPSLSKEGVTITSGDFSKKISQAQLQRLAVEKPIVAISATLDDVGAGFLRKALNENAQSSVPSWLSTAVGAFVPIHWVGISADVMLQLINGSGDAGRLSLANLAGTVGPGGNVAVVERVGKDKNGVQKFIWAYSYTAVLNGRPTTALLYACAADTRLAP